MLPPITRQTYPFHYCRVPELLLTMSVWKAGLHERLIKAKVGAEGRWHAAQQQALGRGRVSALAFVVEARVAPCRQRQPAQWLLLCLHACADALSCSSMRYTSTHAHLALSAQVRESVLTHIQ